MVLKPRHAFRHRVRYVAPALALALLLGCTSHQSTGDGTSPASEVPTAKANAGVQPAPDAFPPIRNQGVGELVVGRAIPRSLLAAESSAILRDGPFHAYGMQRPGESPPAELRTRTLGLAQQGALVVDMIVVTSPKLNPERGVHVGTRVAYVHAAYPDAKSMTLPALWEEPTWRFA